MFKIDEFCFEKYFQLFISLVESKSKTFFVSFPANRFTEEQEGYKDDIYEKARNALGFWEWKKEDVGTGKIFQNVVSAIKLRNNENNLVHWMLTEKFGDKRKEVEINRYEESLFNFFLGLKTDEESFNDFIKYFGENYPLVAYFFFIKDKAQYMPISPTHFDTAFNKLGVQGFKSSHQCSWDNYREYNDLLSQVRDLLSSKGIKDVSLLNAHSFVWMISDIEDKLEKIGVSSEDKVQDLRGYKELVEKDREAIVKARVGQGRFRNYLIDHWQKCCVTGCNDFNVLVASHVKPWRDCSTKEATDPSNGLLLIPNIDALFDTGLISFNDDGKIMISPELTAENRKILGISEEMKIEKIEAGHKNYLDYHREKIFKK
jgi:hypothetical protein